MQRIDDPARVLFFDCETTNLKGNFGYCLCVGYKYLGEKKTTVLSVLDYPQHATDPTNDARLMRAVHHVLTNKADIIVSYYGKEFDRKFLNTRMIKAGLSPLPPLSHEHIDLFYTVRGNLSMHSKRLASVSQFLKTKTRKTELDEDKWVKGSAGHVPSIRYIIEHCKHDVKVLEECYMKLRPFIRTHPQVSVGSGCRMCGGITFTNRGYTISKSKGRERRQQCNTCGGWRAVRV